MSTIAENLPPRRHRPSFGRSLAVRGLDLFDTPPKALGPLFVHEPLLRGVTDIAERFCGEGNLAMAMRARGITVHASDILYRGCPDSTVVDFFTTTAPPPDCHVLLTNPAFVCAMDAIDHALAIGFDVVIFLLKLSFLCTADRFERLHKPGHLRRVHVLAERVQGMHDEKHLEAGGRKASQSEVHAWFVFDRNYCGPATIVPVSINAPTAGMPWAVRAPAVEPDKLTACVDGATYTIVQGVDHVKIFCSENGVTSTCIGREPDVAAGKALVRERVAQQRRDREGGR